MPDRERRIAIQKIIAERQNISQLSVRHHGLHAEHRSLQELLQNAEILLCRCHRIFICQSRLCFVVRPPDSAAPHLVCCLQDNRILHDRECLFQFFLRMYKAKRRRRNTMLPVCLLLDRLVSGRLCGKYSRARKMQALIHNSHRLNSEIHATGCHTVDLCFLRCSQHFLRTRDIGVYNVICIIKSPVRSLDRDRRHMQAKPSGSLHQRNLGITGSQYHQFFLALRHDPSCSVHSIDYSVKALHHAYLHASGVRTYHSIFFMPVKQYNTSRVPPQQKHLTQTGIDTKTPGIPPGAYT